MIGLPPRMQAFSPFAGVVWPAPTSGAAAQLLAMQYQLDATQWWSPGRLRQHQFRQLQQLVQHAARTVPFHAERLRAAGIDPDAPLTEAAWARLKVLTRRDIQELGERLHASEIPSVFGRVSTAATGGSTGIPVQVRKTQLDEFLWSVSVVREEIWHRDDPLGTIVRARAVPPGFTEAQAAQIRSPDGLTLPSYGMPIDPLWRTGPTVYTHFETPIAEQVALMQRVAPAYFFTFPSNLRLVLGHCRDQGIAMPSLRSVWTFSEAVDDGLRALCREVFGVRIVHNYSAAEVGYIALQCPTCESFHLQSEFILVEVLDANGRACAPGHVGRVVVTPLHNFAMPLLRYEIGDEAELGGPCACGRGLPVLTRIVGRIVDHLTLPNGRKRRLDYDHGRLALIPALREFQFIQHTRRRIEAMIVLARALTPHEENELHAVLDATFGEFTLDITVCESIPRTAAGKLRSFMSKLPQ